MEIPAAILEFLKCSTCRGYLSQGPVYLQPDQGATCGRCSVPDHSGVRNTQYEATAKLLLFPCKNRQLGCPGTVPFVDEGQEIAHEEVCEHRQYVCPIGSGCDWIGTKQEILQHCKVKHPGNVIHNSTTVTHDITKSNTKIFLLRAYELLFLLHATVSLVTGRIVHSIKYLGNLNDVAAFHFTLNIKRNNEQISKEGPVAQELTSLAVNISSLLDVLGGFDGTTFTVTVAKQESDGIEDPEKRKGRQPHLNTSVKCVSCKGETTALLYRSSRGWRCGSCAPVKRSCKNKAQGCTYTDFNSKCRKHEDYFCEQHTQCVICKEDITSLSAHYMSAHVASSTTWRVTESDSVVLLGAAGIARCKTHFYNNKSQSWLDLLVYTTLPSERLHEFRCTVKLTDPVTKHEKVYSPHAIFTSDEDWELSVYDLNESTTFPSWSGELDVSVRFTRKKLKS